MEQRTNDWYRSRLGKITGSCVSVLMEKGKGKDFSCACEKYLLQISAERMMNENIVNDDNLFELYLNQTSFTTREMRWGIEQEENVKGLYCDINNVTLGEVGSVCHPTLPNFASSPDGLIFPDKTNLRDFWCIEVKCPSQATFQLYRCTIKDAESLKKVEPKYYWQCQAHMVCTNCNRCDFIVYNPFQKNPIHIVTIGRNDADIALMEERITKAEEIINNIVKDGIFAIR